MPNSIRMRTQAPRSRRFALALLTLLILAAPARAQMYGLAAEPTVMSPEEGGPVTGWTLAADILGGGGVNWRTLAIMHMAMHDALNAAQPKYARWVAPGADEPRAEGAPPLLAMAAAAYQVLLARHPEQAAPIADPLFRMAVAGAPKGEAADRAVSLGTTIAMAMVDRFRPGQAPIPFPSGNKPGEWRPTPPFLRAALVGGARPFLFNSPSEIYGPPPPKLGSPEYVAAVEEVRKLGAEIGHTRTPDQTEAADYWARQTSQRGYLYVAVRLMAEYPLPGPFEEARAMSQLWNAMADSFIIAWDEKKFYNFWRPITAIQEGGFGITRDRRWEPMLPTPPHPDYPSGHASDCTTAAYVLDGVFQGEVKNFSYMAVDAPGRPVRTYPTLRASAEECAMSRLWVGAHFRFANEEGERLGRAIAAKALASVPLLAR